MCNLFQFVGCMGGSEQAYVDTYKLNSSNVMYTSMN